MSLRKQGLYQPRKEMAEPVKTDLFLDLDDLYLCRLFGLGLRHVELHRGVAEAKDNTGKGDAVSLANFGLNEVWRCTRDTITDSHARVLQDEMRHFIHGTLKTFHENDGKYNKASFLLVMRGENARIPRDFAAYPLGKCEQAQFKSRQVFAIIKSDELKNKDLAHAAEQCFQATIAEITAKKIKLATELKQLLRQTNDRNLIPVLDSLIQHYQNGVVINAPILSSIFQCAVRAGCYKKDENRCYYESPGFPYLDANKIIDAMKSIDDKQLKASSKVKRPNEYHHPLAYLCTDERDPNVMAKVAALLPHANAYAKYMAIRRCTLELIYCDACERPRADVPAQYRSGAEHYWQVRRLVLASLTEQECAEIRGYHQQALAKASPSRSATVLENDLMIFERMVEAKDRVIIDRNLQLCFAPAPVAKNSI